MAVASLCFLWDILYAAGECELSTTMRVKTKWKKFKELLPVILTRHLSYKTRGCVYCSCFRNAMHHASETWSLTKPDLHHLQHNNRAMISQICNEKPEDVATVRSNKLLPQLEIDYLDLILREKALLVWES